MTIMGIFSHRQVPAPLLIFQSIFCEEEIDRLRWKPDQELHQWLSEWASLLHNAKCNLFILPFTTCC